MKGAREWEGKKESKKGRGQIKKKTEAGKKQRLWSP